MCFFLQDLPLIIKARAHEAMFYLKKQQGCSNLYMFESSLYPKMFLGFVPVDSMLKLELLQADETDDRCQLALDSFPP